MIDHNHFDDQIVSNLLMKSTSWQNCWVTDKMVEWRMRWSSGAWDGQVAHKMVEWRIKWRIKWRIDFDIPLIIVLMYQVSSHSCLTETFKMGDPQRKNSSNTFFLQNSQCIMTFWTVQWMLGMLVVFGSHPGEIGGCYWSFLCNCQIAEVRLPRFITLRRLCGDISIF